MNRVLLSLESFRNWTWVRSRPDMTRLHRLFKLLSPFIGVHITLHADTSFRPVGRRRAGCPHASLSADIQWSVARVCCTFTTVCYVGRRVVIVVVKNAQMSVRRQSGRRRTRFGRRPTRARRTRYIATAWQPYRSINVARLTPCPFCLHRHSTARRASIVKQR